VVEAMLACGLERDAVRLLRGYWGGMLRRGATTFWEVFDPADERLSPYGSHLMNSYCHAWSCTPAYFVRRHPRIFRGR
jgi:alpha-L-rhamnosidase